ncbi:nucleotidyltransferase domain-containing protein [Candidatus Sulfidibacterium hydrothermale]|uniref:nucleotidyltransferase domain-containing protein n=1 Tax=Candidatus Sulfidibacterium hydrothermale TaxID=2875962 RepID=UPI001F0A762D|nr:nucleotidyltransferase domain-containing protein [Candidatus Sulfidibacterium hydrothermale]UBM61112.1 nucleotidyltransferase domain-containing protein [Candidatus Sulfidibacterium hydrothermale]
MEREKILKQIKRSVSAVVPKAEVILYGSYARGEEKSTSDIDILILLDQDDISLNDEIKIAYPLYEIEYSTGVIISPLILSKKKWNKLHRITPFYENILNEGIRL